jgi:mannose/fructose/N-acetylgalactosamine-specific phosphotransferase system component IID
MQGWERGREFVTDTLRSGALDRLISGATVLGNLVLGAMAASIIAASSETGMNAPESPPT